MSSVNLFKGRNLLIATKHQKEQVIAPILEKELGVKCFTIPHFDTDKLGTFSGEIERESDSFTTVKDKCLLAMELSNCDLAIASEGSFGPHPTLYFVPADDELLLLIDKENNLEIAVRELSTKTNFNSLEVKTDQELLLFCKQVKFPSHGLIVRKLKDDFSHLEKGISDMEKLKNTVNFFISNYGSAFLETDMRAMHNPTRMMVIKKAAKKLAKKIKTLCPKCNTPGFGITDFKKGLPCQICNLPTRSVLSNIYTCKKCNYVTEEKYPSNKVTEEPIYCDFCNP